MQERSHASSMKAFLAEQGREEATRPWYLFPLALMENNGGFWKLLQTRSAGQKQIKCARLRQDETLNNVMGQEGGRAHTRGLRK